MSTEIIHKVKHLELYSDVFAFQAVENHIDLKRMIGDISEFASKSVPHLP